MSSLSSLASKIFRRRRGDHNNNNRNNTNGNGHNRRGGRGGGGHNNTKKNVNDKSNKSKSSSSSSSSLLLLDESYEKLTLHICIDGNQRGQLIQLYKNLKLQTTSNLIETYETYVTKLQISLEFVHIINSSHSSSHNMQLLGSNNHHQYNKPKKLLSSKQMTTLCSIIQLVLNWIPNVEEICFEKKKKEKVQQQQDDENNDDDDDGHHHHHHHHHNHNSFDMDDLAYLCSSERNLYDDDDDDDENHHHHHLTKQMILPFPIIRAVFEDNVNNNNNVHLSLKRLIFRNVSIPDYFAYHHPHGTEDIRVAKPTNLVYMELNHCWWINDVYNNIDNDDDGTTTIIEQYWPNFLQAGVTTKPIKHFVLVTNYYRGGLLDDSHNNNNNNNNRTTNDFHHRHMSLRNILEQQQQEMQLVATSSSNHHHEQQMMMMSPSSSLQVLNLDGFTLDFLDSAELFRTLLGSSSCEQLQELSCCINLSKRITGRFSPTRQTFLQLIQNRPSIKKINLTVMDLDETMSEKTTETADGGQYSGINFFSNDIPTALLVNKLSIDGQLIELNFQRNPNHNIDTTPLIIPLKLQIAWLNVVTDGHNFEHHFNGYDNKNYEDVIVVGNNNNNNARQQQQQQQQQQEKVEQTIYECFSTATGIEMLGVTGSQVRYENPGIQTVTKFWFDLHKLNRKRLLHHNDTSGIMPKEVLVEAMSHVSNNVPLLYFLIQLNPASLCSSTTDGGGGGRKLK